LARGKEGREAGLSVIPDGDKAPASFAEDGVLELEAR
jgi:hypothetical protein